jgi:hypothetical protein
MSTRFIGLIVLVVLLLGCQKKETSGLLPHQTVRFNVGSDFEIGVPGALPDPIKMIALQGNITSLQASEGLGLLLQHKGSEGYDTLVIQSQFNITDLDVDYFKFIDGQNILRGKVVVMQDHVWRACKTDEIALKGELSIIYNAN